MRRREETRNGISNSTHRSAEIGGRTMTLETGKLAEQAHGAVTVRYGDTVVLATAVGEKEAREGLDFFPLTVEYEERMYAAGKIPGGFIKREGRPTEAATLAARLTDRPIRPLFPKGYRYEVQVIITVLCADQENDPDILSVIGASAALMLSGIPFEGRSRRRASARSMAVGRQSDQSATGGQQIDLVVAGTKDAMMMVEGTRRHLAGGDGRAGDPTGARVVPADPRPADAARREGGQAALGVHARPRRTPQRPTRCAASSARGCTTPSTRRTRRSDKRRSTRCATRCARISPSQEEGATVSVRAALSAFEDLEAETVRGGDPQGRRAARRARAHRSSADLVRGRRPAAHARQRDLHARADADPQRPDARLDERGAAARRHRHR